MVINVAKFFAVWMEEVKTENNDRTRTVIVFSCKNETLFFLSSPHGEWVHLQGKQPCYFSFASLLN